MLLATHNGRNYLEEQIDSILNQQNVICDIYISDDHSTDSTLSIIRCYLKTHSNINLLPLGNKFGSAAKNFYRLILDVNFESYDYIAFADQDDIWMPDKMLRAVNILELKGADGYSSNITAFWPNGVQRFIHKSGPQKKYDFLFEPAGPGCTYTLNVSSAIFLKRFLLSTPTAIEFPKHDWLFYALIRNAGRKWVIDSRSSMFYRQHNANEVGANIGFSAKLVRLKFLYQGHYLNNVIHLCEILGVDSKIYFSKNPLILRLRFLKNIYKCRRNVIEGIALVTLVILGVAKVYL